MQEIIPGIQFGDFILGQSVNKIISLLKQKGNIYKHVEIMNPSSSIDPIYINIPSEGIKLRFNNKSQKLELIEKSFLNTQTQIEYSFKNQILFSPFKIDNPYYSNPDYKYITSKFNFTGEPERFHNKLFINSLGASFFFKGLETDTDTEIDTNTLRPLEKMFIFSGENIENSFKSNIYKDTFKFKLKINSNGELKIIFQKESLNEGIENSSINKTQIQNNSISLNQPLEEILQIFNNPNYSKKINGDEGEYYLNYYNYGLDILIYNDKSKNLNNPSAYCNINMKTKRYILHNNNILDSSFGLYDRATFSIEFDKAFLKNQFENAINKSSSSLSSSSFRKFSDDNSKTYNSYEIEKIENIFYVDKEFKKEERKEENIEEQMSTVIVTDNLIINNWSNFKEILQKIPKGAYQIIQTNDESIKRTIRNYIFQNFVITMLENDQIGSIIIYL